MTLAMLSWGAHQTLIQTLESYKVRGLEDSQKVIFFQEICQEDRDIAQRYGYEAIGDSKNIGIGPAYAELIRYAEGDLFLFLENDWLLIENPLYQIIAAEVLLNTLTVDVVKFRHRKTPGHPLWSRQYEGNEMSAPQYLLDSVHWTEPGYYYPDKVRLLSVAFGGIAEVSFSVTTAPYANWTNNPTMFRTQWLKDNMLDRLEGDIEKHVQPWWQNQEFTVAHGPGLFTHSRIDR